MEKKELFRIMAAADGSMLRELAQPLAEKYGVSVVKAPAKTLAMIKLREPVKNSLFYLGEALVCDTVNHMCERNKQTNNFKFRRTKLW